VPSTHSLTKVASLSNDDVFRVDLDPSNSAASETVRGVKYSTLASQVGDGVDVRDYGGKVNGTFDDTASWERVLASGYPVKCSVKGTSNIEGTIVITDENTVTLNAGLAIERQGGDQTTPLIHMYGNKGVLNPRGATFRQD